jgi:hypothetical protein
MTKEVDLKNVNYDWVDAICVDQTNYERRKATIYQMSNIYECATWVLAVPDLHATFLKTTSTIHQSVIMGSSKYQTELYYLLHGKTNLLEQQDKTWLNQFNISGDPDLKRALGIYNDFFGMKVTNLVKINSVYLSDAEKVLDSSLDHVFNSDKLKDNALLRRRQANGY